MSAYRRIPITKKNHTFTDFGEYKLHTCSMQGWRKSMEDALVQTRLPSGIIMIGVLDGHGGEEVSNFASIKLNEIFKNLKSGFENSEIEEGFIELDKQLSDEKNITNFANSKKKNRDSLHKGRMLEMRRDNPDMLIEEIDSKIVSLYSGCTVSLAFIDGKRIVVATLGDCQSILYRGNDKILNLEKRIHNLNDESEVERVKKAGLEVLGSPPRINRELAVSRALGDLRFKQCLNNDQIQLLPHNEQPVSVIPEFIVTEIKPTDEYIFLGCDGIFEVAQPENIIKEIQLSLNTGETPENTLEKLIDSCMFPIESDPNHKEQMGKDNMTGLILFLK